MSASRLPSSLLATACIERKVTLLSPMTTWVTICCSRGDRYLVTVTSLHRGHWTHCSCPTWPGCWCSTRTPGSPAGRSGQAAAAAPGYTACSSSGVSLRGGWWWWGATCCTRPGRGRRGRWASAPRAGGCSSPGTAGCPCPEPRSGPRSPTWTLEVRVDN